MSDATGGFGQAERSVLAIVGGLIVVVVISEGIDFALRSIGVYPPFDQVAAYTTPMFAAALIYRTLAGVAGGYVAAMLAPVSPMAHAVVLGFIGLALSTTGAVIMWGVGPSWYPITVAVLALPSAWFGGRIYQRRSGR